MFTSLEPLSRADTYVCEHTRPWPKDLAKEVATTLGLDPSVVPPLRIEVSEQRLGQRSNGDMRKHSTKQMRGNKSSSNGSEMSMKRGGSELNLTAMATPTSGGGGGGGRAVPTKSNSDGKNIALDAAAENGGGSGTNTGNATPVNSSSAGRDARINRDAVIAAFAATIAAAAEQGDKPVALVIEGVDTLDSSGWHLLRVLCSIGDADETSPSEAGITPPPRRCFIVVSHLPFSPSRQVMGQNSVHSHVHSHTVATHHFCITRLQSPTTTTPLLYYVCMCVCMRIPHQL